MGSKPDTPCAVCGKLLWSSNTSLPAGQRTCLSCRRTPDGPSVKKRAGECASCSASFMSVRRSDWTWTRCCSLRCAQLLRLREQGRKPGRDREKLRANWRSKNHRRRIQYRAEFDEVTAEFERHLRARTRRCPLCKVSMTSKPYLPNSKELDHIMPRNIGGTHTVGNVRIICRTCNIGRPKDGNDYTGPVTLWALAEVG